MKSLKILILTIALSLSAFGQQQAERKVWNKLTATFTSASGTAYTSDDSVGTAQVLTNVADTGRIVTLESIEVVDSANQKKTGYIIFFNGSAPSLTDNAAFAWGSSLSHYLGHVDVTASDYVTFDSIGIASRTFVSKRFQLANTSANLSVVFVTKDTPTYGAAGTLTVTFNFSN